MLPVQEYKLRRRDGSIEALELESYKIIDNKFAVPFKQGQNKLIRVQIKASKFEKRNEGKEEDKITDKDIDDLISIKNQIEEINAGLQEKAEPLALRGIKRALFGDMDVKKLDKKELDKDLVVTPTDSLRIAVIMTELGDAELVVDIEDEEDDKGK